MRNPARIPIVLKALAAAWRKDPDLRLGQLIYCVEPSTDRGGDLFNVEDDELLKRLERWVPENKTPDHRIHAMCPLCADGYKRFQACGIEGTFHEALGFNWKCDAA